ncbi:DHH family phosphoesterase [Paenibacillus endoradicis]|uniref:DHH family phosphoesterase n=1 Tax=Paenibacillus endoradicis TaxID=2972487 RepID=UPI00215971D3|nr:DHH family phosphoesterase [Paenibacillus endoradicis]MCR8658508.1 DHH family phosphoesterase [Paenibacillus endoradicis]
MPNFLTKRWHGLHSIISIVIMLILTVMLSIFSWIAGAIGLLLSIGIAVYLYIAERAFRREFKSYIQTLSYRLKKGGTDVIQELPFGIIIYNEDNIVEWHNPYINQILHDESLVGESLTKLFPSLSQLKDREGKIEVMLHQHMYRLTFREKDRIVYVVDITETWALHKKYDEERLSLGVVMIDNLEEVTQGLDDNQRAVLLSKVTGEITDWAQKYEVYLKRLTSDRFLLITDQKTLRILEQTRFDILDDVREMTSDQKIPMTLSIGFAAGADHIQELGQWSHRSLDIALGRGGDQVTVKFGTRQTFYGGKTNAVEKRTRVRARVVAHTLRDLIKESYNVVIMGHRIPDMDAIGAAVGILKAARMLGKESYIVLEGNNPSIDRMMELLREDEKIAKRFITPEQAINLMTPATLAIVVDTHKASMVAEPKLLSMTERLAVIDHHRRSEEFLSHATLMYLEPYASSTCELVTELLQYIHDRISLDVREATSLLAGITIDTKSFSLRTGARTFEAASFLRRNGADSSMIQRMLQEDLNGYINKSDIIKHATIIYEHIALAIVEKGQVKSQLLIAQSADTLLNMSNIYASFVVSERPDGLIAVSARSFGQINVQVVMELMGGGGHLTNAAAQLEGTVDEVAAKLKAVLKQIEDEEGLFE